MVNRKLMSRRATAVTAFVFILALFGRSTALAAEAEGIPPDLGTASDGRPLYTEETRPDFPVFNSLEGQQYFFSITGPDGVAKFAGVDELTLELNQEYSACIRYCNNGLARGIPTTVYAQNTRVKVNLPIAIDKEAQITASILADNSNPLVVSNTFTILAAEPMDLEIVHGSVQIVNNTPTNGALLSAEDMFVEDGAEIGTNSMIGIVLPGEENAGSVVFKFRTTPFGQGQAIPTSAPQPTPTQVITPTTDELEPTENYEQENNSNQEQSQILPYVVLIAVVIIFIVAIIGIINARKQQND